MPTRSAHAPSRHGATACLGKTDSVDTEPAAEDPHEPCYRIRTQAAEGELESATLFLRVADLTPVESKFRISRSELD
jgi:hypothetical protein